MEKTVDFSKPILEICRQDPGVVDVMKDLGFENITNPAMLLSVGRFMTIPKGAAMKGVQMEKIREAFTSRGYSIIE